MILVLKPVRSLSVKLTAFGSYPQAEQYFNSIFIAVLRVVAPVPSGHWNCKRKGKPRGVCPGAFSDFALSAIVDRKSVV